MSVEGTWTITVNSPLGARTTTVELKSDGSALTGTSSSPEGTQEIADGKADGGNVSWKVSVKSPMPMTLEFAGVVDGDKILGNVQAGSFGAFPFSGSRG